MIKNFFSIVIVAVFVVLVVVVIGCQQEKGEAGLQGDSTLRSLPPDVVSDLSLLDQMRSQIEALPAQSAQDRMGQAQAAVRTLEDSVPLRALFDKEGETWIGRIVVVWLHHIRFDNPTPPVYSWEVSEYSKMLERLVFGKASLEEAVDAVHLLRITRWFVADKRGQAKKFDDMFDATNVLERHLVIYMTRKPL